MMRVRSYCFATRPAPMRRIEDRIRKICVEVLQEEDPERFRQLIEYLRIELHNHVKILRHRAAAYRTMQERRRD